MPVFLPAAEVPTIAEVLAVPVQAAFFADDQAAIRAGAPRNGFTYGGRPRTAGFGRVRQPADAVSVLLRLSDGRVAHGDCAAVQYVGVGGRNGIFHARDGLRAIRQIVRPFLLGHPITTFRALDRSLDELAGREVPLHTAILYGVSQALLDAVAQRRRCTIAEVVRDEYATEASLRPVPIFAQCGDDRFDNVDKMILRRAAALPHGLVNNVAQLVGADGEIFAQYLQWVRDRVLLLRDPPDYNPVLHFDVYGTVGTVFAGNTDRIADYLVELRDIAAPFRLRIEQPIDAGERDRQVAALAALRVALRERQANVQIVADEWCNSLEDIELFTTAQAADMIHVKTPDLGALSNTVKALLHVRRAGLQAYCGGSCTETERCGQIGAQVAMACGASLVLAKPGMGVDEGLTIVGNEMSRVTALVHGQGGDTACSADPGTSPKQ